MTINVCSLALLMVWFRLRTALLCAYHSCWVHGEGVDKCIVNLNRLNCSYSVDVSHIL